jgi:uncharacterized protein with von Willebrand factor type A (vWA) domain
MDPYVEIVQTVFNYARSQFKDLKTFFFHNTIYGKVWEDPRRWNKPCNVEDFVKLSRDTRFIIVGDASMAYWELNNTDGSIHYEEKSGMPSWKRLEFIADTFPHSVWLNPVPERNWSYTYTIGIIRQIFPMFELTLDGLDKAVQEMMR